MYIPTTKGGLLNMLINLEARVKALEAGKVLKAPKGPKAPKRK